MIENQREPATPVRITATINQTALATGISRSQLYRLAAAGKIVFRKCGRTTLVDWASMRSYLDGLPQAELRCAA